MRNITIILLLIFQSFGGFTQGHPECVDPCLCLSGFVSNKYWAKAKIKIDSCVKTNFGKDNLIAWYIRGKVYQGIYESNDSRYLNLKDSSLYKAKTSYVKSFCLNINSDTIDFNQLLNDSTYRLKNINNFSKFSFKNYSIIEELKDSLLPQLQTYLNTKEIKEPNNELVLNIIIDKIIKDVQIPSRNTDLKKKRKKKKN